MRVIISLTAIPPRFHGLSALHKSLAAQTYPVDHIEINIPRTYRNPKFEGYSTELIPEAFDIHFVDQDLGPVTKIAPTIQRYWGQEVLIIYLDDDRIYRPDLVETLVRLAKQHPSSAIAAHTVAVRRQLREAYWRQRPTLYRIIRLLTLNFWNPKRAVDNDAFRIAEGFGGVLVRPEFFDGQIAKCPSHLRNVDDVWLSGMLALHQHNIISVPSLRPSSQPNIVDGEDTGNFDALVRSRDEDLDRYQANELCIRYLQDRFGLWNGL
jgi:hypothetical protein